MIQMFLKKNKIQLLTAISILFLSGLLINFNFFDFQANLFNNKKAPAYDGLVMPVQKIPDWVNIDANKWNYNYASLNSSDVVKIPKYDPAELTIPFDQIDWNDKDDLKIRNAQITYSVPYMGNYKLDGHEHVGSHLAVDIKTATGTPVHAIGNGVVVKTSNISTGFGKHVVVRHDDFPSYENPKIKTTYYSSYSHLNSIDVNDGEIVLKNQIIGTVGDTGTATTPHLHFQIDKDNAPWHPYWPFTSAEAAAAGLSFFEAINTGFAKEKALSTTINPMLYVQKYADEVEVDFEDDNFSNDTSIETGELIEDEKLENNEHVNSDLVTPTIEDDLPPTDDNEIEKKVSTEQPVRVDVENRSFLDLDTFELKYPDSFTLDQPVTIKIIALDENRKVISDYEPESEINIAIENGSAELSTTYLKPSDFNNGSATFTITPEAEYGLKFSVTDGNDVKVYSKIMKASIFSDLTKDDPVFAAVNFLKNNEIVRGYPDGSFKAESPVSRVEALKFIYEGLNKDFRRTVILEFRDTDSKAWYARYVAAAHQERIIEGYPGNYFLPANTVTRAEFIKMLLLSADIDVEENFNEIKPYQDVELTDWHIKYIAKAKEMNLLDPNRSKIQPNEPLSRGEVSEILYKLIVTKLNNRDSFSDGLVVSNSDIEDFYN
ncbi:peptidoglycan DD-metalloendopeptidase family protein [Candidatus Peregrinibacteria bacterium]|nr:peptidoglycan DD-metalloendopeptidase family protein [Candidatus Peregrinibacteria bacterium]